MVAADMLDAERVLTLAVVDSEDEFDCVEDELIVAHGPEMHSSDYSAQRDLALKKIVIRIFRLR